MVSFGLLEGRFPVDDGSRQTARSLKIKTQLIVYGWAVGGGRVLFQEAQRALHHVPFVISSFSVNQLIEVFHFLRGNLGRTNLSDLSMKKAFRRNFASFFWDMTILG